MPQPIFVIPPDFAARVREEYLEDAPVVEHLRNNHIVVIRDLLALSMREIDPALIVEAIDNGGQQLEGVRNLATKLVRRRALLEEAEKLVLQFRDLLSV